MNEGDEMKRRSRRKNIKKAAAYSALAILAIIILLIKTNSLIKPVIKQQAAHFAEKEASEIIESCVSAYLDQNKNTYSDYAAVLYNDKKQPVSIETISYTINKTQSELTLLINKKLKSVNEKKAEVPIGTLTQSYILNGKGPKLHIKISAVGSAEVKLKSEFESAGINQTKHRILALIKVKMTSSTPLNSFETNSEFEFLIAENIIIGETPQFNTLLVNGSEIK